jgi:transposase
VLLFEDEISLSNTATVSYKWGLKGEQPKINCKQRNRERQTVFGSLNYGTGKIIISFEDKGNSKTFKKHLKKILKEYKDAPKIFLVLDNVKYHHAKRISKWIEKQQKLELVFLPPYSPDLNAIERVWWYMRKKITHNRFIKTLKERKIEFWKMFSHFQKPNEKLKTVCEINY